MMPLNEYKLNEADNAKHVRRTAHLVRHDDVGVRIQC